MTARGTTNRNDRGSAADRRTRKLWLLREFGDGATARCALAVSPRCPGVVTFDTLSVDRIVPGVDGGRYVRGNIQPSCGPCNSVAGALLGVARRSA